MDRRTEPINDLNILKLNDFLNKIMYIIDSSPESIENIDVSITDESAHKIFDVGYLIYNLNIKIKKTENFKKAQMALLEMEEKRLQEKLHEINKEKEFFGN